MKFIVYLFTLFFVGTAIAQNPTILQGNYISNVFGQSNFILNPNAQTSVANVTTVTATVTRSTTTPLVATSEFTVAIGTANGTATWATRAFDAGMKGQNCEARFTYRGFAATSKVHVKQGANTVATLNLTPATDPRIASINFPCGDLSTATTFVVTDTAILAGTNEISGIYTGLATNMANVAQAEYIGYGGYANGATIAYWDTSTPEGFMAMNNVSLAAPETSSSSIVPEPVVIGNLLRVRFNGLKPGNYHATFTGPLHKDSSGTTGTCSYTITPVTVVGSTVLANEGEVFTYNVAAIGQDPNPAGGTLTSNFAVTSTQDVYLYIKVGNASSICRASVGSSTGKRMRFHLHRFPTSSELVVTPERQNTWGSATWTNAGTGFQSITNNTFTAGNSTIFGNANATVYGPTATATGNTSEIKISNMPVGAFRIMYNGSLYANTGGSATNAECSVRIRETSTSVTMAQNYWSGILNQTTDAIITNIQGVFRNTSVGDRTFRVEIAMTAPTTGITTQRCGFLGQTNTTVASGGTPTGQPTMVVQPLDQPSNSALYVEGPVKASATGAAIPAGYVGETKTVLSSVNQNFAATTVYKSFASLTLEPGVWQCVAAGTVSCLSLNCSDPVIQASGGSASALSGDGFVIGLDTRTLGTYYSNGTVPFTVRATGSNIIMFDGTSYSGSTLHLNGKVNYPSGTPQLVYGRLSCTRLN